MSNIGHGGMRWRIFFLKQLWPICERLQGRNTMTFYDSLKWRILAFCHGLPSAIDNTAHKHKDGSFASPEVNSFLLLLQRVHEGRELSYNKTHKAIEGCNVFSAETHRKSDLDLLSQALKCSVLYELRYEIWRSNASFSGSKWIDHLTLPWAGMAILWRSFNQVNTRRGGILIGPCDPTMCEGTIATTLFDMLITPFDSLLRVKARL